MKTMATRFLASVMVASLTFLAGCNTSTASTSSVAPAPSGTSAPTQASSTPAAPAFELKTNVDFLVSSKAGGGSDIFTRSITDIASTKGFVTKPFIVNNLVDGAGQISRRQVSTAKNVDSTLLCFSSGDLTAMLTNGGLSMADFTPIAILAADKHLAFVFKDSKYKDMKAIVEAAKAGTKINVGGTSSDEMVVFGMMVKELGLEEQFNYIIYGSAAETITALLGGHVDMGFSKPAASQQYVVSGDIVPVVAFSTERFAAPFDQAPTMQELGYATIEYPVWRGVIGPKDMTAEGLAFWSNVFKQICETEEWKTNYLDKNLLVSQFMDAEATKAVMLEAEQTALAAIASEQEKK